MENDATEASAVPGRCTKPFVPTVGRTARSLSSPQRDAPSIARIATGSVGPDGDTRHA